MTAEQMKTYTEEDPDVPRRRALLIEGDVDRVYCSVVQAHWSSEKDNFHWNHSLVPADWTPRIAEAALAWAVTHAQALGATSIQCWVESYRADHVNWLLDHGFVGGQTNPVTFAPLMELPLDDWAAEYPVPDGMKLVTSADLREAFPDRWHRMIYDFDNEVMADVPLPAPFVPSSLEQFVKEHLESPYATLDTQFFLMEGDAVVCGTSFQVNRVNQTMGNTGLTGTLSSHRRQGLARIIKIAAMRAAREMGVRELETDNEEANPMLQLNLALGFRVDHTVTNYSRKIAP